MQRIAYSEHILFHKTAPHRSPIPRNFFMPHERLVSFWAVGDVAINYSAQP